MSHETNYEALRSAFDTILTHIKSLDQRTQRVAGIVDENAQFVKEHLDNTLDKTGMILENMNDRMQRLEDKFEQLDGDLANRVLESYIFSDGLKDAVRELTFTVEVN